MLRASFEILLERLAPAHKAVLQWFEEHEGQEVSWPQPLPDGTFIVNKAKGIHKPAGMKYAVSVRQSLNGPYADRDPVIHADGSWTYRYFQGQLDPARRDSQFTNVALLACKQDGVPIGVLRQVKAKPQPRYLVLGLAFVTDWSEGYFELRSIEPRDYVDAETQIDQVEQSIQSSIAFNPSSLDDARRWVEASIVLREGQPAFRRQLLRAYDSRCAISGCDVVEVLEAAHICRYLGAETNVVSNGLLLRADLHTLYDRALLAIDPGTHEVLISPDLMGSQYAEFAGRPILLPKDLASRPSPEALLEHAMFVRSVWEERSKAVEC